jgi:predicted choloylglycine hydrolase
MTSDVTTIELCSILELAAGAKWQVQFRRLWPAHRAWYLRDGDAARPSYLECIRELRRHLPELLPVYERLVELAGGGDLAARYLAQYRPPAFFAACSQLLWLGGEPALIRNYDYSPHLFDGLLLYSAWSGRRVIAMTDGLIGVLDGVNEEGLGVSLAFGGRRATGNGFGITIVLRYVLEMCATVKEAEAVLGRVPVHAAYIVALIDRAGGHATVMLGPDREPLVSPSCSSTNHQGRIDWPDYARLLETEQRLRYLREEVEPEAETLDGATARFLSTPLYRRQYAIGFGTLYTAVYRTGRGEARYAWPGETLVQSFDRFGEGVRTIRYTDGVGARLEVRR